MEELGEIFPFTDDFFWQAIETRKQEIEKKRQEERWTVMAASSQFLFSLTWEQQEVFHKDEGLGTVEEEDQWAGGPYEYYTPPLAPYICEEIWDDDADDQGIGMITFGM
jgi:hypothetical protein